MINTVLLGKYVYKFLTEDARLAKLVGKNIFPVIVDEDINFPFIIFGRDIITPVYTKCGLSQDRVEYTISIVSDDYENVLNITNNVRQILDGKRYTDNDISIIDTRIIGIYEDYIEHAYVQTISLEMICQ